MNKYWKQTTRKVYALLVNEVQVATLQFTKNSQAEIYTQGQKYRLTRKKSWSRSFQVVNEKNHLIIEVTPRKWYSNDLLLRYQHQEYLLRHRNNPLHETVLQDLQKRDILAYGKGVENLKERITVTDHRQGNDVNDHLLDTIVWFAFRSAPELDLLDFI
ncbi:MAG TPA: hypothetical protein DCS93_41550 [Microscillaceae bacterium]|nr:hypothetical protein [Microscillaceae bacterium]